MMVDKEDRSFEPGSTGRVVRAHSPAHADSLALEAGETLSVLVRDDESEGYVWCSNTRGEGGWVPEGLVGLLVPGVGMARGDYSGVELAVEIGDELVLHESAGGWYRAADHRQMMGWLPAGCVEISHAAPARQANE